MNVNLSVPQPFRKQWVFGFVAILSLLVFGYWLHQIIDKTLDGVNEARQMVGNIRTAEQVSDWLTNHSNDDTTKNTLPKIIETVDNTQKGIIKKFDVEQLWKRETERVNKHIFSSKHTQKDILELDAGKNKRNIFDLMVEKVKTADSKALLKESSNDIVTQINGQTVTVRVFINNGEVTSINAFTGTSNRVIYNLIKLE